MQKVELMQHPLSAAFPSMSEEYLAELAADIKAHGQKEPVILYDGMILDGWHRYLACKMSGKRVKVKELPDDEDPKIWVQSANLHRRHLDTSQRASAVVAVNAWAPPGRPADKISLTNAQMAEIADVSPRTISRAKEAYNAGMGDEIRDGKLSLSEAEKQIKLSKNMDGGDKETSPRGKVYETETLSRDPPSEDPFSQEDQRAIPPEDDDLEPQEMISIPKEELEQLQDALRECMVENEEMGKVIDSDDHLKAAVEDRDKWKRKHDALEARFRGQTNELNECKKVVKRLQGAVKKQEEEIRLLSKG